MCISSQPNIVPNKFSDDFYTGVEKTQTLCLFAQNLLTLSVMFITIRAGRLSKIRYTGTFNLLIAQQLLECTKPQRNVNGAKYQREFFTLNLS